MHGGISSALKSLDDIRNVSFFILDDNSPSLQIRRPLVEPNTNQLACDLLWADPMVDLSGYIPNTMRGVSVYFGEDTVLKLCETLKLDLIVRAHQMMMNGYGFFCRRKMVTIFSAPRYYPNMVCLSIITYIYVYVSEQQGRIHHRQQEHEIGHWNHESDDSGRQRFVWEFLFQ
jgi:diadenosine tetraphosphatase ApaH/serine/threonine PP2A family protein phosphatase